MSIVMEAPSRRETQWGAVVAVSLGIVLFALDMTIVAVSLPVLGADFGAPPAQTQWVVLAYSLPLVALSIPAGRWLDVAGPLPSFLLAIGGFGVASVLIAAAPSWSVVLGGRVLQGVFGSLIGVVGMPIIASSVRPEHRARAMSIILTLIPLAGVAGPGLGGVLAEAYGWRSVFLVNIPVVLIAGAVAVRTIPARQDGRAGLPVPGLRLLREALVLGAGATALFLALDLLGRGHDPLLPAVLGATAVVLVVAWLRLPEAGPVLGLLKRRTIALGITAMPMITAGVGALNFLVPYFFVEVLGESPRVVGVALLAMAAGMAVCSPLAGVLADRIGTWPVVVAGAITTMVGTLSLLTLGADATVGEAALLLAVVGIGNGLFAGPNSAAILAATPPELAGTSSGVTALLRTMGFSVGPAIGALSWTVAAGGTAAFHLGLIVLSAAAAVAVIATVADRPRTAH